MDEIFGPDDVTAVILAGGRATRLGGVDKGLHPLGGKPLVEHVLTRLRPQTGQIIINCNRCPERYAAYGLPLVADRLPDFPGPLAGLHAALQVANTPLVLTVPCDSPYLPEDLLARLLNQLGDAPATFACTPERQPVFALYRRSLFPALEGFLRQNGHRVGQWLHEIGAKPVDFSDCAGNFQNFNAADDWP